MSDDMRTKLTAFAAEFITEAEAEQRLKEVFGVRVKKSCLNIHTIFYAFLSRNMVNGPANPHLNINKSNNNNPGFSIHSHDIKLGLAFARSIHG